MLVPFFGTGRPVGRRSVPVVTMASVAPREKASTHVASCRAAMPRAGISSSKEKKKAGPGGVRARNPPVRSAANFQEKVNCGKYSVARAGDPGSPGARVVACAQLKCRQAAMGIRQPPDRQVGNSSKTTDLERARTRPVRAINPTGYGGLMGQHSNGKVARPPVNTTAAGRLGQRRPARSDTERVTQSTMPARKPN